MKKFESKPKVPCPTCQQIFRVGTALATHQRMKHSNGNGHTNGNGTTSASQTVIVANTALLKPLDYFELPLSNGLMLRIEKTAGLQMASTILAELSR